MTRRVPQAIDAHRLVLTPVSGKKAQEVAEGVDFDTMVIVIILVAGLGVIGRSQGSAHA